MTIYRRFFYDSKCYNKAPSQAVTGVQVHSTGANNPWLKRYVQPDDGRLGYNINKNHHNNPEGQVCASAYIGKQADGTVAVYQTLPWSKRCWLSGSGPNGNANQLGFVGYEICEDGLTDRDYFGEAVLTAAVNLTAHICLENNIPQADIVNKVLDHHELHAKGLASDHGDITHWLRKFGYSMNYFRQAVIEAMNEGVHVTYIDCDTSDKETAMYDATVTCSGSYLNLRSAPRQDASVVATMPWGSLVAVLDDSDPTWWRITYMGSTGYAMAWKDSAHTKQWITPEYTAPVPTEPDDDEDPDFVSRSEIRDAISRMRSCINQLQRELDIIEQKL